MIRLIAICLLTVVCLTATAQQKQLDKLQKWYKKGHYETCYDRANYFLLKYKAEPEIHLYVAMSAMRTLRVQRRDIDTSMLNALLEHTAQFHNIDLEHKSFSKHRGDVKLLHKYIQSYANKLYEISPSRSAEVHVLLATVFNDTTDAYRALYLPETLAKKVQVDTSSKRTPKRPQSIAHPLPYADSLVAFASMFAGTPYKYSGCDPKGFDCSGFINYVYQHFGIEVPRTSKEIAAIGKPVSTKALMPGDILVFGYVNKSGEYRVQHVGMVHEVGDGSYFSIIHSVSTGVNIDDPMSTSWDHWTQRLISVRRLPQVLHN